MQNQGYNSKNVNRIKVYYVEGYHNEHKISQEFRKSNLPSKFFHYFPFRVGAPLTEVLNTFSLKMHVMFNKTTLRQHIIWKVL